MILATVFAELATQLGTITGLKAYAYPPDDAPALPAAWCDWPDEYVYDATMGRGSDDIDVPVFLAVARIEDMKSAAQLSDFVDGSGSKSIKAVLQAGTYSSFASLRVASVEFKTDATVGATPVLLAQFHVLISGKGSL